MRTSVAKSNVPCPMLMPSCCAIPFTDRRSNADSDDLRYPLYPGYSCTCPLAVNWLNSSRGSVSEPFSVANAALPEPASTLNEIGSSWLSARVFNPFTSTSSSLIGMVVVGVPTRSSTSRSMPLTVRVLIAMPSIGGCSSPGDAGGVAAGVSAGAG
jgi:hypothetical protein